MNPRFLSLAILLSVAIPAQGATQLVLWTFGPDSDGYTTNATSGVASGSAMLTLADGEIDTNGKNGVDYTDSQGSLHTGGRSAAWDDVKVTGPDAEAMIEFSTLGYEDIAIRFDYRSEGTESFDLAYSLNGTDFTQVVDGSGNVIDNRSLNVNWASGDFDSFSASLSGTPTLENVGTIYLRLDDLEEGDGNDRFAFDNLEITASAIPEPSTALLLVTALCFGFRRKRS